MSFFFWYGIPDIGLEKGGLAQQGKKVSGGHFFSPRKSPMGVGAQSAGLWTHTHPPPPWNHLSSGKSLAVGQVIDPSPISSTKPDRKVGLFFLSSGKSLAVGQVIDPSPMGV